VHDSVFVKVAGDTVTVEKWHTLYRDKIKIDTMIVRDSVVVRDSVYVDKSEVTVEKWKNGGGWLWVFTIIIIIIYLIAFKILK
jgi:hypothetical protein